MRSELLLVALCVSGCALDLRDAAAPASPPPPSVAVAPGCALARDEGAGLLGVLGEVRTLAMGDGQILWLLETLRTRVPAGGEATWRDVALPTPATPTAGTCPSPEPGAGDPVPLFDAASFGPGQSAQPLAPLRIGATTWLYFARDVADPAAPYGIRRLGYGIARADGALPPFHAVGTALWTGDRPSFGVAAVQQDELVYVYGCKNAGFLNADCYVARVGDQSPDDASAYAYSSGGGHWSSDLEHATPIFHGGGTLGVQFEAGRQRYVAAYVTPLGNRISVRSGLSPSGPWSEAREVAGCALPAGDRGSFCGGVALHPELGGLAPGTLAVTYAIQTFQRPAGLGDDDYASRLVQIVLPTDLP